MWSVLAALHSASKNADRVSLDFTELDFTGIEFPVTIDKIGNSNVRTISQSIYPASKTSSFPFISPTSTVISTSTCYCALMEPPDITPSSKILINSSTVKTGGRLECITVSTVFMDLSEKTYSKTICPTAPNTAPNVLNYQKKTALNYYSKITTNS